MLTRLIGSATMNKNPKLIACYIAQDEELWLPLSLKSILGVVDKVIIIDGGSTDKTLDKISEFNDERIEVHYVKFDKDAMGSDGKQRGEYLKILKEKYMYDWAFVIDCDEIVSDNFYNIRNIIRDAELSGINCCDIHMEHFIWNFGQVDASADKHFVLRRLFKVTPNLIYPEIEHSVLEGIEGTIQKKGLTESYSTQVAQCENFTIFHCGYINGVTPIINKYHKHLKKSRMHSPEFLKQWRIGHLIGGYPTKHYHGEYPKVLKEYFLLE